MSQGELVGALSSSAPVRSSLSGVFRWLHPRQKGFRVPVRVENVEVERM